jgi:ECF sigma factor
MLNAMDSGDPTAAEELLPLVYQELRKLAAHKMAGQASGHTLQATALVHEAWLRLAGSEPGRFAGRAHFFAGCRRSHAAYPHWFCAAGARGAARRRAGRVDIEGVGIASLMDDDELLAVHVMLDKPLYPSSNLRILFPFGFNFSY